MRIRSAMAGSALLVLAGFLTACSGSDGEAAEGAEDAAVAAAPADAALTAELDHLRETSAKYADVNVALAEGFIPDPSGMCITSVMEGQPPEAGAMGIHYLRPDLLALSPPAEGARVAGMGTHTDFETPAVLLYEPQMDGSMRLVGIENLVFAAGWTAAGNTTAPEFMGQPYVHMLDDPATEVDEAHGFEEHYELHMWIQQPNPNGVFTPFNPSVTCEHAAHDGAMGHGQ